MSYTRPAADNADLSFLAATSYTRPAASDADLTFLTSYEATTVGNILTMGTGHEAVYDHTGEADSFGNLLTLGVPSTPLPADSMGDLLSFGSPAILYEAVSLGNLLTLPMHSIVFDITDGGMQVLTMGTGHTGYQFWRTMGLGNILSMGPIHYFEFDQSQAADSLGDILSLGRPGAIKWTAGSLNRNVLQAYTAPLLTFGTPAASAAVTVAANSLGNLLSMGDHAGQAHQSAAADSLGDVLTMGTGHSNTLTLAADSLGGILTIGTPTAGMVLEATSLNLGPRFGTPAQWGEHMAASVPLPFKFGQPSAVSQFRYPAESLGDIISFGEPVATENHIASSLRLRVRMGIPQLERNPAC